MTSYDVSHNPEIPIDEQAEALSLDTAPRSENINLASNFTLGLYRRSDGLKTTLQTTERKQMEEAVHFFDIPLTSSILSTATNDSNGNDNETKAKLAGLFLDSGAARSVVGHIQNTALCEHIGFKLKIKKSNTLFIFGTRKFPSLGKFKNRLNVLNDQFIEFSVEVVSGDFSLLVGLEVMRALGLILNFEPDTLYDAPNTWSLPILYDQGHAFVFGLVNQVLFTGIKIRKELLVKLILARKPFQNHL